jgi:hypothetical protein
VATRIRRFIGLWGQFFPKHAKVVNSLMRTLDGREQETLRRLLRGGDIVKFVKEIRMREVSNAFER